MCLSTILTKKLDQKKTGSNWYHQVRKVIQETLSCAPIRSLGLFYRSVASTLSCSNGCVLAGLYLSNKDDNEKRMKTLVFQKNNLMQSIRFFLSHVTFFSFWISHRSLTTLDRIPQLILILLLSFICPRHSYMHHPSHSRLTHCNLIFL